MVETRALFDYVCYVDVTFSKFSTQTGVIVLYVNCDVVSAEPGNIRGCTRRSSTSTRSLTAGPDETGSLLLTWDSPVAPCVLLVNREWTPRPLTTQRGRFFTVWISKATTRGRSTNDND